MLKPKEMSKIRVVAGRRMARDVVEKLHALNALHVKSFARQPDSFFDLGSPFPESGSLSETLLEVRGMMNALDLKIDRNREPSQPDLGAVARVKAGFNSLFQGLEQCRAQVRELERETHNPLLGLATEKKGTAGLKSVVAFHGTVQGEPRETLGSELGVHIHLNAIGLRQGGYGLSLIVPRALEEKAKKALMSLGFKEHALPVHEAREVEEKSKVCLQKEKEALEKWNSFRKEHGEFLQDAEAHLARESEKAEAPLHFASSASTFVAEGWVPRDRQEELVEALKGKFGENLHVEILEQGKDDAPVALANPGMAKPFEFLVEMYSLPKYGEIDPTLLVFLAFPFFFGFMLGDLGYGLVTLLVFSAAHALVKGESVRFLLKVMMLSSLASIVFGFVYDEFFGLTVGEALGFLGVQYASHALLHRAEDIVTMMVLSVGIGVVHITLGLLLGFQGELKRHGLKAAVLHKGSWLLLEWSILFMLLDAVGVAKGALLPAALGFLLSAFLLFKGEGIAGILEMPQILTHVLSYVRLFGFGLASVELAVMTNLFAGMLWKMGGVFILVAVLLLLLGHVFNIVVGIYAPFIQSLRLHYVEFFTKFYEGGGKKYVPFGTRWRQP